MLGALVKGARLKVLADFNIRCTSEGARLKVLADFNIRCTSERSTT